jgi:hypothetical protein
VELASCFVTSNIDLYVRTTAHEKFSILSFRVKIQGLILIGVPRNVLVEGIVLRVSTFFRVKI